MAQIYLLGMPLENINAHDAGRQLLQQLYTAYVGSELPPIEIASGGKPYFVDSPWHFSISHCQNHAFCALASCPVGLDAEEADRVVKPLLAEKILSAGEYAQYCEAVDKNEALLTFWVLKEAQGKLEGKGVGLHPRHTDFMLTDSRVQRIQGCLVAVLTQEDDNHAV